MSWQRCGHPLRFFWGQSHYYVFSDGERVHDYDTAYPDDPSFCELIQHMVERETGDEAYSIKIMLVLAEKIGCLGQVKPAVRARQITDIKPDCFGKRWDEMAMCHPCIYSHRCLSEQCKDQHKDIVEFGPDYIRIHDWNGKEIIHWSQEEWEEDPDLVFAIGNVIQMASEGRMDEIKETLGLKD